MTRRLPIRWRIVLAAMALVVIVLVLVGGAVLALERRDADRALRRQADAEARSLLAVASPSFGPPPRDDDGRRHRGHDDDDAEVPLLPVPARGPAGLEPGTSAYLVRRGASDILLAVSSRAGPALLNGDLARALVPYLDDPPRSLRVDGEHYVLGATRDAGGITALAAVPGSEASAQQADLIRAMALAGAIGLLIAIGLGWLGARSALRPLTEISERAGSIRAGRLDQRVGPLPGHDEIAALAAALDAMLERLETAFVAQQRFVQDASHELRTPITIARGHLEVVDPAREDPLAVREALDLAVDELDRMGRLVERLLVLARAGELPAGRMTDVDLAAIAHEAVARTRDDDRTWSIAGGPGVVVRGDRDALIDVLVNLLNNARRHTAADGHVGVVVRRDGPTAVIEVHDDGDGLSDDMLERAFDRFTRADAARTRDGGGAGLGLAICRAYVEAHGGTIAAANGPDGGAVFRIALPVA